MRTSGLADAVPGWLKMPARRTHPPPPWRAESAWRLVHVRGRATFEWRDCACPVLGEELTSGAAVAARVW
jgi:hypothetical protein